MSALYIRNTAQSTLYEKEFRARCALDFNQAADAIKNIAVVGVARPMLFGLNGGDEDSVRIRHMLNFLAAQGEAISPDFELDAVSFTNGRDFLKEDKQYDMVFVSCIPRDEDSGGSDLKVTDESLSDYMNAQRDEVLVHRLAGALSDEHCPSAWAKRLQQSGAKLCVTFGGQDEINTGDLRSEMYEELLPTPDRRIRGWTNRYETSEEFYGKPNNLPMLWLGMLKKKAFAL
jgi:hypothetical protein